MSRVWFLAVISLMAVAIALAGCGSSSSSSSGTTAAGSSGSTTEGEADSSAAVTQEEEAGGQPIVIGSICACTGAFAANDGAVPRVVKAWENYTNTHGGINGHPVNVKLEDDGGNSSVSSQKVKALIEQDHVMAIAGENDAGLSTTWESIPTKAGVPVIGGPSFSPPFWTNPNFFPTGGTFPINIYGMLETAKAEGDPKVAVIGCVEAPSCAGFGGDLKRVGKAVVPGVEVVYSANVSGTAPSYTAQCLAAEESGATSMYVGHAGSVVPRVIDGCVQQGYQPLQLNAGGSVTPSWAEDSNLNGMKIMAFHLPANDTSTPGGKHFHEVLDQEDPGLTESSSFTELLIDTWDGLELFAAAAEKGNIGPTSTPADVKKGLYALKGETLGGLTPPLTFQPGKPTVVNCYFEQSLENGEFTNKQKPVCASAEIGEKANAAFAEQE